MVDVATLALTADTSGLKKAETALDSVAAKSGKTEAATKKLGDSITKMGQRSAVDIKKAEDAQKKLNAALDQAARYTRNAEAVERARARTLLAMGQAAQTSGGGMALLAANARGASYQVSDMATQLAMGTSAFVVMGQQLPQLIAGLQLGTAAAGGFAMAMNVWLPIGAAVLAVAAPLAMSFMNSVDPAQQLDDAMSALSESTNAYLASSQLVRTSVEELTKTYGSLAAEVVRANQAQAGQDLQNQMASQTSAAQALLDALTQVETVATGIAPSGKSALFTQFRVLADDFGLADDKAQALVSSLEALASARGPDQVAQAALAVQAALDGARDSAGQLPPPLAEAYGQLTEMITAAGQVKGEIQQYPGILGQGASAASVMAG